MCYSLVLRVTVLAHIGGGLFNPEAIKNAFLNNERVMMGFTTESGSGHGVMVNKIKIWSSGQYKIYFAETSPTRIAPTYTRNVGASFKSAWFWSFSPR